MKGVRSEAIRLCIDRCVQSWRTVPGNAEVAKEAMSDLGELEWAADCVRALNERHTRLIEALNEIESFPISGYHAGEAQRIARAVLAEEPEEQI